MAFPLGDYIDAHHDVPYNLGQSGMLGSLRTFGRSISHRPAPDPELLRRTLARLVGAPAGAVFLTHGATEANAIVLQFLSVRERRRTGRTPRLRVPVPEYPPLPDTGRAAGFRVVGPAGRAEVAALSNPRNPLGTAASDLEIESLSRHTRALLVDETFREFTPARSLARLRRPGLWVTGTFTKAYGADTVRVGFLAAPAEAVDEFADYHPLVQDRLAPYSVAAALALLRDRDAILAETRSIVTGNERALRERFPELPPLAAPVWLDPVRDGDAVARRALRSGVLVCPGSFFGARNGVRIGLTRRNFSKSLEAYLAVRQR